jgi:hypothetical protein
MRRAVAIWREGPGLPWPQFVYGARSHSYDIGPTDFTVLIGFQWLGRTRGLEICNAKLYAFVEPYLLAHASERVASEDLAVWESAAL